MSGLCGVIHWDGAPVDEASLRCMAQAAGHRGTDGISYWTHDDAGFAYAGLIITPESRWETQPVHHVESGLILVADARIDNRDELTAILHKGGYLSTDRPSDADLVLAASQCWGVDCAAHLIGDFAFAIWDGKRRRLFAARDPMSMRPFYYRVEPRRLLFASEVKQILAAPGVPAQLFEPAVAAHLSGPYGRPEWTFYDGISQLAPAHALWAEVGDQRTWRYWDIDPDARTTYADEDQYGEHFRELFSAAVRCRLRSVKPLGIMLSGGMDSGSIASTAGWLRRQGLGEGQPAVRAYSWAFEELPQCDERHISEGIVRHYGIPVTNVPADQAWPLKGYPDHGPDQDEPFIWPYQTLIDETLALAQSEGMGVMLSGDRGDELVGDWVFDHVGLFRTGQWALLRQELRAQKRQGSGSWLRLLKNHLIRPLLLSVTPLGIGERFRRRSHSTTQAYPAWVDPEFAARTGLADLLEQSEPSPKLGGYARRLRYGRIFAQAGMRIALANERVHSRYGLNFADPWSDRRLAAFILAVPQFMVQRVREPKRIARQAMRGIMPEAVRHRAGKIEPDALYDRGFKERARSIVEQLLTGTQAAQRGFLDERALRSSFESFLRGAFQRDDFWWAFTLEMWLRAHWA